MKGLMLKDIINLKQSSVVFVLVVGVWLFLSIMNGDPSFFCGVTMLMATLMPITAISYDEKANWNKYALTMPVSRFLLVLSKYTLSLLFTLSSGVLATIVCYFITGDINESLKLAIIFASLGMMMASVILPFIFKYGAEKGRLIMMAVIFIPIILIFLIQKSGIPMPDESTFEMLINLAPVIALFVMLISVFISKSIIEKKEF